jgi:membrane protein YdbS with pleckstrin-like domain
MTEVGFPRELLTADETVLLELKPSSVPFVVAPLLSFSALIVGALLWFGVLAFRDLGSALAVCGLPLIIFAVLMLLSAYIGHLTWRKTYYAITDKRVVQKSGLMGLRVFDAPLTAIQNVSLIQPWLYKLFDTGVLLFATSGTGGGAAMTRASISRMWSSSTWLAGNIVFAGVRDPVATRKRAQEVVDAAVAQAKERDYRKMAETFREVGSTPMATERTPPVTVTFPSPRRPAKFCEYCGTPLTPSQTFCSKCGGRAN